MTGQKIPDPQSLDELTRRTMENTWLTGLGLDVTMHIPCPFCGSPDWLACLVIDSERILSRGATCQNCGRGARMQAHISTGSKSFEMIQTEGDNPPAFMPTIRRGAKTAF